MFTLTLNDLKTVSMSLSLSGLLILAIGFFLTTMITRYSWILPEKNFNEAKKAYSEAEKTFQAEYGEEKES